MTNPVYRLHSRERYRQEQNEAGLDVSRFERQVKQSGEDHLVSAPIIFGYAGVSAVPVYTEYYSRNRTTTGISNTGTKADNTQLNRDLYGRFLDTSGNTRNLIVQYVVCDDTLEPPLAIFVNNDSYGRDGWRDQGSSTKNPFYHSCHHWNSLDGFGNNLAVRKATTLASVYARPTTSTYDTKRDSNDVFQGLTACTGLYRYADQSFNKTLPRLYCIMQSSRIIVAVSGGELAVTKSSNALGDQHSIYGALAYYLLNNSVTTLGIPGQHFHRNSWTTETLDSIARAGYRDLDFPARIRKLNYEVYLADTNKSAQEDAQAAATSPLPVNTVWPCWGAVDTSKSVGDILKLFKDCCPPLNLWQGHDGLLRTKVTNIYRRADFEVVMLVDDKSIIEVNTVDDISQTSIRFNNYENDFASEVYSVEGDTTTKTVELCGSLGHARKIKNELDTRTRLSTVNLKLTRHALGLEPGDVIRCESSVLKGLVVIEDAGLDEQLQVIITGKLLTAGTTQEIFNFGIVPSFDCIDPGEAISITVPTVVNSQPQSGDITYRVVGSIPSGLHFDEENRKLIGTYSG